MSVFCRHFGVCGGCQSQDVPYAEQLSRKRRWLDSLLRESAGRRAPRVEPVVGMPVDATGMPVGFRHKAAFVFAPADSRGGGLVMGHYAAKSRRVVPVEECPVHSSRANRLAFSLRDHLARAQVRAAGPRLDGVLRHVVVRTTSDDREALVLLVVTRNDKSLRKPLRAFLASDDRPDGLFVTTHDRDDPYMIGETTLRIDGRTHIRETGLGAIYQLSPAAFFQTNPLAAAALVEEVVAGATRLARGRTLSVLDLFAGSGLFALPLALAGHTVRAVEENRAAVADGVTNARLNRIPTARLSFVRAPTESYLGRSGSRSADLVVIDPPRQGASAEVLGGVFRDLAPPLVLYVSCNPQAFARELPSMLDAEYQLTRVKPVDMFPHTDHVEIVATLKRVEESKGRRVEGSKSRWSKGRGR